MIIWIRNRKGWIGAVFFGLAVIFALSFIIGGVGTGSNASLSDIFNNGGGGQRLDDRRRPRASRRCRRWSRPSRTTRRPGRSSRTRTPSASRPTDEAAAWTHFVALKPGNLDGLQRLALAQAQVAANLSNQAQT